METLMNACREAAQIGGQVLVEMRGNFTAREKAPADLVTEADVASQRAIRARLLDEFPEHAFIGEEQLEGESANPSSEYTWVVDPLDGTTNYVHGMENYCVSVALLRGNDVLLGAVYDPVRQRCFHAASGGGAFCDQQPIRVSHVDALDQALVAASFPPIVRRDSTEVRHFLAVLERGQATRRLGSAALNLCYVACGHLDAYWATCVRKWDIAAGLVIAREAGAVAQQLDGGPIDLENPQFVVAAGEALHAELMGLMQD